MSKKKLQQADKGQVLIIDENGDLVEGTPFASFPGKLVAQNDGPLEINITGGTENQRMFLAGLMVNTMQGGGMTPIGPVGLTKWENDVREEAREGKGFGYSLGDLIRERDPDLFDRPIPVNINGSVFERNVSVQGNHFPSNSEIMLEQRVAKLQSAHQRGEDLPSASPAAIISNALAQRLHAAGFRDVEVTFTDPTTDSVVSSFM